MIVLSHGEPKGAWGQMQSQPEPPAEAQEEPGPGQMTSPIEGQYYQPKTAGHVDF